MADYESLLTEIEKDLSFEQFELTLPLLLEVTENDAAALTHVYCVGVRCYFVARQPTRSQEYLEMAHETAQNGGPVAVARVALTEASILNSVDQFQESEEQLAYVLPVLEELPLNLRSLALALHGRNEAMSGAYAEAITHSQSAIAIGPPTSSSAAFANMTIALVFQVMDRFEESEQFALEQIRIYKERGSKQNIASSYSMLAAAASAQKLWDKAMEYQKQAQEAANDIPTQSSNRALFSVWKAYSELELGDNVSALEHAKEALILSEASKDRSRTLNAKLLFGFALLRNDRPEEALEVLLKLLGDAGALGDNALMILYKHLADTYIALNRREDGFEVCYKLWQLQSDFNERTREALLRYHKALEKKIHFQEMAHMKTKSDSLERELSLQTMSMAAQMDLLARFRDDLRVVVRNVNDPGTALKQVKEKLKALPCEQIDWAQFEAQFTSVHPEFRKLLIQKYPELTPQEVRVCQLLRVGMKSFEVAKLICISERGVESHRANIRKKLALKTEQSLTSFLEAVN